ncbi:MAG: HI0074 family nucleotidyltransferase substrate-binding subunit [Novosphingobium sp.]
MLIDLSPLQNAIGKLEVALARHAREPADEEVRDSVIQRFEFTYDLSHKMLRRVLEATGGDADEVAQMTFPTLIRTGWEQNLVAGGWPMWSDFRTMRNKSSHTYDIAIAIEVAAKVPKFLEEAKILAERLAARLTN